MTTSNQTAVGLTPGEIDEVCACIHAVSIVSTPAEDRRAALRRLAEIREAQQAKLFAAQKAA